MCILTISHLKHMHFENLRRFPSIKHAERNDLWDHAKKFHKYPGLLAAMFFLNLGNLDTSGRSRYIESRGAVARTAAEQWNNKDLGKSLRYHSHRPQNYSSFSPPAYCWDRLSYCYNFVIFNPRQGLSLCCPKKLNGFNQSYTNLQQDNWVLT